jgi:hypothetical protein
LFNNLSKEVKVHHFVITNYRRAKAALQIADIADFNMNFVKALFHFKNAFLSAFFDGKNERAHAKFL